MYRKLLLTFFVYAFYCTLATGVSLHPGMALTAATPVVMPQVAALGSSSALGALRTLSRLRVERALRLARLAGLDPPPLQASARPIKRRGPMRKFTTYVSWAAVLERFNPEVFRQAHGLSYEAFEDLVKKIRPLIGIKYLTPEGVRC